jgi:adenine-specific DNA-methyltransferase
MPILNWLGKDKVVNHHQQVPYRVLELQYTYGQADGGSMIVHGDNLDALKSLLPRFEGRVKLVYIDPPYNTGNEGWVYNDNVNDPKIKKWLGEVVGREGEDLSRHDKWLCMMYPRLKLLQRLLADDGAIFISIDENEYASLKLICQEIFGASNHVATISWQKRYSRENREAIGDSHEYILIFASDPVAFKNDRNCLPLTDKQLKGYINPDNDPRGSWQSVSLLAQGYRPNQMYEIISPSGKKHLPPEGNCWKVVRSEYDKAIADNRIFFGKDGLGVPRRKQFLSETKGLVPWTWWPHEEVGHTDEAKKETNTILGKGDGFDTPKPVRLLSRIIQIATKPGDIILDSFAGSGTTAHAALNMNKRDGGNRRFILVEMMDYAETITAERVRRVIDGYADIEGTGGGFAYYELGDRLLLENGNLNETLDTEKIREYVWYTETRSDYTPQEEAYLLGVRANTAYYFYYEKNRLTVLNHNFLRGIRTKAGGYLIYADLNTLSAEEMDAAGIKFKKIPRDITRL